MGGQDPQCNRLGSEAAYKNEPAAAVSYFAALSNAQNYSIQIIEKSRKKFIQKSLLTLNKQTVQKHKLTGFGNMYSM